MMLRAQWQRLHCVATMVIGNGIAGGVGKCSVLVILVQADVFVVGSTDRPARSELNCAEA